MEELEKVHEALSRTLKELEAIEASDSIQEMAEKLGVKLDSMMDPMTPLADTMESADDEAQDRSLTNSKKLVDAIDEKLSKALGTLKA